MHMKVEIYVIYLLGLLIINAKEWNDIDRNMPYAYTLDNLINNGFANQQSKVCLRNAWAYGHSINSIHPMSNAPNMDQYINGSTIWINEFMALGHAMYDIYLIEL